MSMSDDGVNIGKFKECDVPGPISDLGDSPLVLPAVLAQVPQLLHFAFPNT